MQKIITVVARTAIENVAWKRLLFSSFSVALMGLVCPLEGFSQDEVSERFLCTWYGNEAQLKPRQNPYSVRIVGRKLGEGKLQFYLDEKLVFTFAPKLYPIGLLTLDDGNLASIWSHGNGKKRIVVFSEENAQIKEKLNEASKLMAEFCYVGRFRQNDFKKLSKNNSRLPQCILIPQLEWKETTSNGKNVEFQPISRFASVFCWNRSQRKYLELRNVEWDKRLD